MIHPTAIIDVQAELHESVSVGPFSVIGPEVKIGEGCVIESDVVVKGACTIGKQCHL